MQLIFYSSFYCILLLQSRNLILRSGGKGGCLLSTLVCWYPHSHYSTQIASSSNPSGTLSDSLVVSATLTSFPATSVVFSSVSIVASFVLSVLFLELCQAAEYSYLKLKLISSAAHCVEVPSACSWTVGGLVGVHHNLASFLTS